MSRSSRPVQVSGTKLPALTTSEMQSAPASTFWTWRCPGSRNRTSPRPSRARAVSFGRLTRNEEKLRDRYDVDLVVCALGWKAAFASLAVVATALTVTGCGGGSPRSAPDAVDRGTGGDRGETPDASGDVHSDTPAEARGEGGIDAGAADLVIDTGATTDADAATNEDAASAGDVVDAMAATDTGADAVGARPEILVVATYLGGISSLRIDPVSGGLTPVTSSLDSGGQLYGVAAHPSGDFVYAADFRGRIYGYRVNRADGSLVALPNLPLMIGGQAITPAVDPQGRFLYATNSGDNSLYAYHVDAGSGALAPVMGSPFPLGATPTSVCFHPSAAFAYVSSSASSATTQGGIRVFSVEPASGVPTEITGSPFAPALFGGALTVHPNGNFLFDSSFGVHVLAIDPTTRGVHELSDSPYAGAQSDNQAADIAVDPLAQYLYASSNLGTVTAYRLDATTAAFGGIDGSPYPLQGMPYSIAIDPTGRFAYVGNDDAEQVWAFSIERSTGQLQMIGTPVTVHGLQPEMVVIGH